MSESADKLAIEGGKPIRDLKKIPFPSVPVIDENDVERVVKVLRRGILTSLRGTEVAEFEREFAAYYGARHAIATTSGTTALHAAIAAARIGPGDEVITTPITFIATVDAILHNNAIPVFADVDPKTHNISPDEVSERVTDRTRAILPVHIHGHPCDMDPIMEIAEDHRLFVIEDCAQAHGAEYKGRKVGTMGDAGCFSLWETKNIGVGEGGVVITDDDRLAERVRSLINHCRPSASPMPGVHPSSVFVGLGYNYRMAEVQGALAIGQIRKLDRFNKAREDIANLYRRGLEEVTGIDPPYVAPNVRHAWYMFVCTVNRDEVRVPLNRLIDAINAEFCVAPGEERVQRAATRGTLPIYFQPILAEKLGYGRTGCPFTCPIYGREVRYEKGMCPNAESLYETSLSLFINHAMSPRDAMDIVRAIRKVSAAYTRGRDSSQLRRVGTATRHVF